MPGLVYHHRYRITVRLRRHKGYIPLKGSVEVGQLHTTASRTLRGTQCQNQARERVG